MIEITPEAVAIMKKAQLRPQDALRLGVKGGGCSGFQYHMQWDIREPREGDKVLEFDGLKVYVDPVSFIYLDGVTIHYLETLSESGFTFVNPNVANTCGCGKSFNV